MCKVQARQIVDKAIMIGKAKEESREEYSYALNVLFSIILNVITAVVLGIVTTRVFEMLLFIAVYKFLREYSGGHHAKTAKGCYISSCIMYVLALALIEFYNYINAEMIVVMMSISTVILIAISPVDAEKKPLDDVERKVFGRRARINLVCCAVSFFVLRYWKAWEYSQTLSNIIAVALLLVLALAIVGKFEKEKSFS